MALKAAQVNFKSAASVRNAKVAFSDVLDGGERFTGTPTVTIIGGSTAIVVSSISVSTGGTMVNGSTCSAGQVILFNVSGGVANTRYELYVSCVTDATPAQTLDAKCPLIVEAST